MDFLKDAISSEISKKRKTINAIGGDKGGQRKKYVSRAELERLREEEYHREEELRKAKEEEVIYIFDSYFIGNNHNGSSILMPVRIYFLYLNCLLFRKNENDKKKRYMI